jgi:hypothetical protein
MIKGLPLFYLNDKGDKRVLFILQRVQVASYASSSYVGCCLLLVVVCRLPPTPRRYSRLPSTHHRSVTRSPTNLSVTYEAGKLLNGVILLQRINSNRVTGSESKRTRLFRKICGESAFSNVVIATTMWETVSDERQAARHEQERIQTDDFWGRIISRGARTMRHHNTAASAKKIIDILVNKPRVVLQMQEELASNEETVNRTSAEQQMDIDLNEVFLRLIDERNEAKTAREASTAEMRREIQELNSQLAIIQLERQDLQIKRVSVQAI